MTLLNNIKSYFTPPVVKQTAHAFSFGDPEPILNNGLEDSLGVFMDMGGDYYRPPVSFDGLAKLMGANPYHGSILHFKKHMVLKWYRPSRYLNRSEMQKLAFNLIVTGNGYLQVYQDAFGRITRLATLPSISMRRGEDPRQFFMLKKNGDKVPFKRDEVLHLKTHDLKQEIYGLPEYLGGIQSVLLSEESTLFRRKYYINGAHMGYILVTNDADLDDATAEKLKQQVKSSKGPGNFRSLYLNIGRSQSKEPVKVIPVGDIGTKDEYERIKNVTQTEMLAMHRMRPELSGIIPQNTGGFGDPEKSMKVYHELEITALQAQFLELNDTLGVDAVLFDDPVWLSE